VLAARQNQRQGHIIIVLILIAELLARIKIAYELEALWVQVFVSMI
jgi:hypothetical protein